MNEPPLIKVSLIAEDWERILSALRNEGCALMSDAQRSYNIGAANHAEVVYNEAGSYLALADHIEYVTP